MPPKKNSPRANTKRSLLSNFNQVANKFKTLSFSNQDQTGLTTISFQKILNQIKNEENGRNKKSRKRSKSHSNSNSNSNNSRPKTKLKTKTKK
tara:strand:+ start:836 stop:1114 length:279 start_codon:yes stop_codon:yes gene_type:complete